MTGTDAEQCELTFAAGTPTGGSLGNQSDDACAPGSPNTDSATIAYTAPSEAGSESFTYTVSDGVGGESAPATVAITVTAPPSDPGTTQAVVDAITASQFGGKNSDHHVDVAVSVTTQDGVPVSGADVAVTITHQGDHWWSGTATTSGSGVVFGFRGIPQGSYTASVTAVTPPSGFTWTAPGDSVSWTKQ
jgi:hypothetical protein